jgi:hypothetical protein
MNNFLNIKENKKITSYSSRLCDELITSNIEISLKIIEKTREIDIGTYTIFFIQIDKRA